MKTSFTLEELKTSLAEPNPPAGLANPLTALWWDAKGDWTRAHDLLQNDNSPDGSWVHAYLHRKEPDPAKHREAHERKKKYCHRERQPGANGPEPAEVVRSHGSIAA